MTAVTRFAPSPTGDLHLGGALCALASWVIARASGGRYVIRVEDLDPPRVLAGSEEAILEDLRWLGLAGEMEQRQSARFDLHRAAIEVLEMRGLVYPCDCSRQEIARVSSAPHLGEEIGYPGTCRDRDPARDFKRPPALRLRAPEGSIEWDDLVLGPQTDSAARVAGDFVLMRGDGVFAYQLACAVDDWSMGITDVVRGNDLLSSTPRQLAILIALGAPSAPRYGHLPLVRATDGSRLAKRTPGALVRDLRARGHAPEEVIGVLGHALGLASSDSPCALGALVAGAKPGWLRTARELRVPKRFI